MNFNETDFQSLVKNGMDFLRKSMAELEAAPKYSVINFYPALELFLKARLMRELFGGFESVVDDIGNRIADGILGRIKSFPELVHVGSFRDRLTTEILAKQ